MPDIFGVLFAIFLLLLNAFFVAAEFSLISSRRDRLDSLVAAGNTRAERVIYAIEHLSVMLAGAQFGITVASVLLGKVGEPAIAHLIEGPFQALGMPADLLHPVAFSIALLIVTILHIILGEMVPKNIALAGPESVALYLVGPHLLFVRLTRPIIVFLNWIARLTLALFGIEQKDELDTTVTRAELASMIAESRSEGLLDPAEHRRLSNALAAAERTLSEVLIPLSQVHSLDFGEEGPHVADIEQAVSDTGYSRFPVLREGAFIGYIHVKDILDDVLSPHNNSDTLIPREDIRELPIIPSDVSFDLAMKELRKRTAHMALVAKDQDLIGIVTLEDIIEELVGTVRDWTHDE